MRQKASGMEGTDLQAENGSSNHTTRVNIKENSLYISLIIKPLNEDVIERSLCLSQNFLWLMMMMMMLMCLMDLVAIYSCEGSLKGYELFHHVTYSLW